MTPEDLQIGDPVWAKMKGYPPWPAKIVDPPPNAKKPKASYVKFFGTGDHAWILNENIIPHSESMLTEARNRKKSTAAYQNGIDALVSYAKSYKRVKQPKLIKKSTAENNVNAKKVEVVQVFNSSISRKYDRRVLSKSLLKRAKAHRKRSFLDFNGKNSNSRLAEFKEHSPNSDMYHCNLFNPRIRGLYINPKHVKPSQKTFGFIGLGMMGKQIVKALLESGHEVNVWNRTPSQCDIFVEMGAKKAKYPSDLVINCDIVFSCVSDVDASKAVLFGENGILTGLETASQMHLLPSSYKGFVEMTSIDPFTSQQHAEAVQLKNAAYLEAPLCGSSKEAEEGKLVILAAGDRRLFSDCETCFHAISKNAYYLSCEAGDGSKMNLALSRLFGTVCASLAEAMVFVERLKLQKSHFLECLEHGPLACPFIIDKAHKMDRLQFQKVTALKHVQKDTSLALLMGHQCLQPLPITSGANEVYKHGKARNYSNEDMSAVYKVVKY